MAKYESYSALRNSAKSTKMRSMSCVEWVALHAVLSKMVFWKRWNRASFLSTPCFLIWNNALFFQRSVTRSNSLDKM